MLKFLIFVGEIKLFMELSIIIPLLNESESIEELHQWIHASLSNHNYDFEIIYVDDGSTDDSWEVIERLVQQNKNEFIITNN